MWVNSWRIQVLGGDRLVKLETQLENVSKSAKSRRWQGLGPKIWRMRSGWKPPMKQCIRPLIHLFSGVLSMAAIAPCMGLDAVSPRPVQSAEKIRIPLMRSVELPPITDAFATFGSAKPTVLVMQPPLTELTDSHAESVLAKIQRTGQLRIGLRWDAPPFGYVDSQGEWTGYCVDFANSLREHLTQTLGATPAIELVEMPSTLDNRFQLVQSGSVDLECGPNTIREGIPGIEFSNPFFATGTRFLIHAQNQQAVNPSTSLNSIRVGVLENTTNAAFVEDTYPDATIVVFTGQSGRYDAVQAVNNGEIDTFVSDGLLSYAEVVVQGLPTANFVFQPDQPLTCEFYGMALPDYDPEWASMINNYLASTEEEQIWAGWFEKAVPQTLNNLAYCLSR